MLYIFRRALKTGCGDFCIFLVFFVPFFFFFFLSFCHLPLKNSLPFLTSESLFGLIFILLYGVKTLLTEGHYFLYAQEFLPLDKPDQLLALTELNALFYIGENVLS